MIFVSQEQGSADLAPLLEKHGIEVDTVKLDFADIEFTGKGIGGSPLQIGIEVKRLSELTSDWDRLAGHQIPKMLREYAYRYLLYEGEWKQDKEGRLVRRTGRNSLRPLHGQSNASALRKKLYGLPLRAGVLTYPTQNRVDTIRHIIDLYRMWTDDDFEKHRSHLVIYEPHGLMQRSEFVEAVGKWPGIGLQRAIAAEKRFKGSVRRAAMAGPEEWAAIETTDDRGQLRKLGMKTAMKVDAFLDGRDE